MKRSIRSIAAVAVLTLAVTPSLYANQTGCNPHPKAATSSSMGTVVGAVLSLLGM